MTFRHFLLEVRSSETLSYGIRNASNFLIFPGVEANHIYNPPSVLKVLNELYNMAVSTRGAGWKFVPIAKYLLSSPLHT